MPFVLCGFFSGGKAHGPRGPKSYFYMLPTIARVQGLSCALSVKYAQNHLYIVDSLEIPTEDPQVHMLLHFLNLSDCCLMPSKQLLSYIIVISDYR